MMQHSLNTYKDVFTYIWYVCKKKINDISNELKNYAICISRALNRGPLVRQADTLPVSQACPKRGSTLSRI